MKRNPSSTNLREWASNFNEFLHSTPESDRANKDTIKVLGTIRKMNGDTIFINGTDTYLVKSHQKESSAV